MAAPRPEHAHATDSPATATLPPRPYHTTTGWRQDRRPVVSKRPLHSLAAAKMSPHIHIGSEPVLSAHARSPPATGSHCPAGADSAPHSEQNFLLVFKLLILKVEDRSDFEPHDKATAETPTTEPKETNKRKRTEDESESSESDSNIVTTSRRALRPRTPKPLSD
jgi:hypothetical protein